MVNEGPSPIVCAWHYFQATIKLLYKKQHSFCLSVTPKPTETWPGLRHCFAHVFLCPYTEMSVHAHNRKCTVLCFPQYGYVVARHPTYILGRLFCNIVH